MDEQLQKAVVSHDVGFVKKLLNSPETLQPPVIDYKVLSDQLHEFKWPLKEVVDIGEADLTRHFLRAGNRSINVDERLHRAVYNFDVDHVRLFLQEFNVDPNCCVPNLHRPIYQLYSNYDARRLTDDEQNSVTDRAVEIIKMLIERGAKLIVALGHGYNELQVRNILVNGTTEAVSIILDMDELDLKFIDIDGGSVVHLLAMNRNPNTLTLLQNRDFPLNLYETYGVFPWTPLVTAADCGNEEAVEFLLKKGADVNFEEPRCESPLCRAILGSYQGGANYMECILLLLEHGVDVQTASYLDEDDVNFAYRPLFDMLLTHNQRFVNAAQIILQHLALKKAIGTIVIKVVQDSIDSSAILKNQFDYGRQLLENKIYGSHTLLSVLTCREEKLISLMRNEQLAEKLWSHADHLKSIDSIYYNRMLQKRLTKAGEIIELRGKAAFVVEKLMKMDYNCHPGVLDMVLRYLDLTDLNTLLSLIL